MRALDCDRHVRPPRGFVRRPRVQSRTTLQDSIIRRFDAQAGEALGPIHGHQLGAVTGFQPLGPGVSSCSLLSSAQSFFTVQANRLDCSGGAKSTEVTALCNFLRTKPLLCVHEGALFCLRGPYNGADLHRAREWRSIGSLADGAPDRA